MNSPFKFLDSFSKEDKDIYFGRERETEDLYLRVFESKILLVYGVSGTGKSSLIHCGLANKFNDSDWLPVNVRRGANINHSLKRSIIEHQVTPLNENKPVTKHLQSLYLDHFKPLYLVFDQFEELFIFGSKEERNEFVQTVKEVVESDLNVHFIFVIREEYLASITEFEKHIPGILNNRVRIEKMTRVNAVQCIEGPCRVAGIKLEDGFTEELLDRLSPEGADVELTYLQVFLDKIFRTAQKEQGQNELVFTKDLLDRLGNVGDLLGSFLEEQIAELEDPDSGLIILKSFVSTRGTKRQITEEEVHEYSRTLGKDMEPEKIRELIQRFVALRILRDKDSNGRYELRHDALAAKIYEKITLVEKELLEIRQFIEHAYANYEKRGILLSEQDLKYIAPYEDKLFLNERLEGMVIQSKRVLASGKRIKKQVNIMSVISLLLLVSAVAYYMYKESVRSRANELAALSLIEVEKDPTVGFRLAQEAYRLSPDLFRVKKALFTAYFSGPFYKRLPGDEVAVSPDGNRIITLSDSSLYIFDSKGELLKNIRTGAELSFAPSYTFVPPASFDPGSSAFITYSSSPDTSIIVWNSDGTQKYAKTGRHNKRTVEATFHVSGKFILYNEQHQLSILNTEDGTGFQIPDIAGTVTGFSPDGKRIAYHTKNPETNLFSIVISEFPGLEKVCSLERLKTPAEHIYLSNDLSMVILDLVTGEQLLIKNCGNPETFTGSDLKPSKEGKNLFAWSESSFDIYSEDLEKISVPFTGKKKRERYATIPGNRVVFSSGNNQTVLYDYGNGKTLLTTEGEFLAGAPNGFFAFDEGRNTISYLDGEVERAKIRLMEYPSKIFATSGDYVVIQAQGGDESFEIRIYPPDKEPLWTGKINGEIQVSGQNHIAFAEGTGDSVVVINPETGASKKFKGSDRIALSPAGKYLVTVSERSEATITKIESKQEFYQGAIKGFFLDGEFAFSSDDSVFISSGIHALWYKDRKIKLPVSSDSYPIMVSYSPNSDFFAFTDTANQVVLCRFNRVKAAITVVKRYREHSGNITGLAFAHTTPYFFTTSLDSTAVKYDFRGNSEVILGPGSWKTTRGSLYSIKLSPSDKFILTGTGGLDTIYYTDPFTFKVMEVYNTRNSLALWSDDHTVDRPVSEGHYNYQTHPTAPYLISAYTDINLYLHTEGRYFENNLQSFYRFQTRDVQQLVYSSDGTFFFAQVKGGLMKFPATPEKILNELVKNGLLNYIRELDPAERSIFGLD